LLSTATILKNGADKVKINITNKQYRALIQLIYAGNWVVNGHRNEPLKEYEDLDQYIFSLAKQFGMDNLITHDIKFDSYFPTQEFEDKLHEFIDEYEEVSFWDELERRLASRDLDREGKRYESPHERMQQLFEIESKYAEEFNENGLKNVKVMNSNERQGSKH
jgi:hypothetical protein